MISLKDAVTHWNIMWEDKSLVSTGCTRRELSSEECIILRSFGFKPHERTRFYGFDAEFISYPYPHSRFGAAINVREPGNPSVMLEAAINPAAFSILSSLSSGE